MKTLHLDTESTWRGGQQQLLYLLEGLAARGIGATLLAQPGSPVVERARAAGIDARPFASCGEADLLAAWRLARLLRGEPFDVFHCHTAHAHGIGVAARWLTPRLRQPKLVVARRVLFGWNPSLPPSAQAGLSGFARWKYRQAGRIIAVSNAVRQGLVHYGLEEARIVVVRDGVDVARIEQAPERNAEMRRAFGLAEGEKIVLHIAPMTGEKGQRTLLMAAPLLCERRPDARLVLVGDGPLRAQLEREVRVLGVAGRVIFAGSRLPEELPSLLKAADVFVYPSLEEGLGSILLEAMAANVPIVATRVGGIPELVRDEETGLLVPRDQFLDLAEAIVRLLDDSALARRLAEAARQFVRAEGTKDRMIEETIGVYQQLAPRDGGAQPAE